MDILALHGIRPETLTLNLEQLTRLWPLFVVFGGACITLVASVLPAQLPRWTIPALSFLTVGTGLAWSVCLASDSSQSIFGGMFLADPLSYWAAVVFFGSAAGVILISYRYLQRQALDYAEYYVLVLLSALGMVLMASTLNLLVLFIALELMSLSVYVLVGFRRADRRSNEAAVKYFILGSAASAILLYGTALIYGTSLSLDLRQIAERVLVTGSAFNPMFLVGILCVLVGFLFKVASFPFHTWMPDVYEGAPTPVTAFMTTGLKAAVVIALARWMWALTSAPVLPGAAGLTFHHVLWVSAVLTMFVGNVVALQQTQLKRMLAYSSVAHSGYLLVGLLAGPAQLEGFSSVLFYILVYAVMNLGAFSVLCALSGPKDSGLELNDLSGLASKHPWLAFALACFLFSMAGLPPTAGFTSKYYLFYSAVQAGEIWLVVLGVLCSAIAAYYYLRVIVFMYMREPVAGGLAFPRVSRGVIATCAVALLLVLQLGILPSPVMQVVSGLLPASPTGAESAPVLSTSVR